MTSVVIATVGQHRNAPRFWLEGRKLNRGGFRPGDSYRVVTTRKDGPILVKTSAGDRTVSRRKKQQYMNPVIDISNQVLARWFSVGDKLRVVIRKGRISIRRHILDNRIAERVQRIKEKLDKRQPLDVHSLFHGGGIIDAAIHSGFNKSGVSSFVQVAVERSRQYLDLSIDRNPQLFTESSILIEANIQDLILSKIPFCNVLVAGLPCTGASLSGLAKNAIEHPEDHPEAGPLFIYFLNWVQASNPAIVILENVKQYAGTASMSAIRSVLRSLGYELQERIFNGNDFGALESRERLCLVAVTEGLDIGFSLDAVSSLYQKPATLADVLEPIALDDPRWRPYDYLKKKQTRDKQAGNNFKRQLFVPSDTSISTLTRSYHRGGSTVPFIVHPENPELSRKVTALEHARIKGLSVDYLDADEITETLAHEVMGQSVIPGVFEAIAFTLGTRLMQPAANDPITAAA